MLSAVSLTAAEIISNLPSSLLPAGCSEEGIKILWDSVFKESSNYTVIKKNAQSAEFCNYLAYKDANNKTYVIIGANDIYFTAIVANYNSTTTAKNEIVSGNTEYVYESSALEASPRNAMLTDAAGADSSFKEVFKLSSGSWSFENSSLCTGAVCDKYSLWEEKKEYNGKPIEVVRAQVFSNFSFNSVYYYYNCDSNWSCSEWAECIDNRQTRICSDTNGCGDASGKPNETAECISCVPEWNCTEWQPQKCPKENQQTRVCTDANDCNDDEDKPDESLPCEYKSNKGTIIIILIVLAALAAILIIFFILKALRKNKNEDVVIARKNQSIN